jgi:hypothetical protein
VLTTELPVAEASGHLENRNPSVELGTLYELVRTSGNKVNVRITKPFSLSTVQNKEWSRPFGKCIGRTRMSHEDILKTGSERLNCIDIALDITEKYPGYQFISNNCQNFVRYLVEAIVPGSIRPDTIEEILCKLFLRPRAPSRSSTISSVSSGSRVTSISSASSLGDAMEGLVVRDDQSPPWEMIKAALPPRIQSDIQRMG